MVLLESLAAIGCVFLLWSVLSGIFRPSAAKSAVLILPSRQDGTDLEQSLRWIRFLRKTGLFSGTVFLLEPPSTAVQRILPAKMEEQVEVISLSELNAYFAKEGA